MYTDTLGTESYEKKMTQVTLHVRLNFELVVAFNVMKIITVTSHMFLYTCNHPLIDNDR